MRTSTQILSVLAGCLVLGQNLLLADSGGFTPTEAVKRMTVAEGLEVKLVTSEPEIRQPLSVSFDSRGRMWVLQYLQYPHPAGLKPVKVDEYLRTVYDKVPEPPPKGPKGIDHITICEDTDGDGKMDKFKDFITDLNLASGFAVGYDGVFVAQPPYLLFYPDRNHDDVPDGDPEVLLSGFGMEDAHAFPNSLQWGPDGWLYGAAGSTTTSHIRGIEFQQGIWRYHPVTKEFELFAEGGGNTWGLDFDEHGNVIAGTNYEKVSLHQVQGAYYVKNFGKHGALHNPYTFGFFEHIPYKNFKGGHVTCGGIVYQGHALPSQFDGTYVAGNLLANAIYWHTFKRDGSSFTQEYAGDFLVANDPWFRPVDCQTGPDGAIYIADWYDKRATHVDPRDNWDKSNGRVYKVQTKGAKTVPAFDLSRKSSRELLDLLSHPNEWYVQTAREILAERHDSSAYPGLRKYILDNPGKLALESLWALYASGGLDEPFALKTLTHTDEDVRAWTVRLLGDARKVSGTVGERLQNLAETDPSPVVRNQLACTAKRLPGKDSLPIVRALLHRSEDVSDPQIPMLLWWAVEDKAISDRERVLALVGSRSDWQTPIIRQFIIERLGRRYAAEENDANFATCARLLEMAPGPTEVNLLLQGMEKAFEGRSLAKVPPQFEKVLNTLWSQGEPNSLLIRFACRLGSKPAVVKALALVASHQVPDSERVATITLLGQIANPESQRTLVQLVSTKESGKVQAAALTALQSFPDPEIAPKLLAMYPGANADLRNRIRVLLTARSSWALALLQAVDRKEIDAKEVPLTQVRKIAEYSDKEIPPLINKYWGKVQGETTGEKLALVRGFVSMIKLAKGDPAEGHKVFQTTCAVCHSLFAEGNHIGPDLTVADRKNLNFLLENILSPSLAIRPEYISYNVELKDERSLTGLIVESSEQAVTILDASNQRTVLARSQIKSLNASAISLMPEGLLEALSQQQVRDLFAYLQSDPPK